MPIRQRQLPDTEFVDEFQETILPSAIPSTEYVDWENIHEKTEAFADQLSVIEDVARVPRDEFEQAFIENLMEVSDPELFLRLCFRLIGLGDSKNTFVVKDGWWDIGEAATYLENGNEETAAELTEIFENLGLPQLLNETEDIAGTLAGVEIGLESNSRKNRQGKCYSELFETELAGIVNSLTDQGYAIRYDDEVTIDYTHRDGDKRVDFGLFESGELRIVFELNCYSAKGSKPSSIKRSYETVAVDMRMEGYEYVWVTDGLAWKASLGKILGEAYRTHGDFYNLSMVRKELEDDIANFLEQGPSIDPNKRDVSAQRGIQDF